MKVKILHIFDDLMNLYGEYANVSVLQRYLTDLGHEVTVDRLGLYEKKDISLYDFYFMGSGTETKLKLALSELKKHEKSLKEALAEGKVMLFTGNSFELLGAKITDCDGKEYEGLKFDTFSTVEGKRRIVGDGLAVYGKEVLVGFINKCSKTSGVTSPLFKMKMGFGNDKDRSEEGFCKNNCFGTHLTGPLLVKNPAMLRAIAEKIVGKAEKEISYEYMEKSYQITLQALEKRLAEPK